MIPKLVFFVIVLLSMSFANETVIDDNFIEIDEEQAIEEILEELSQQLVHRVIPAPFSYVIGSERVEVLIYTQDEENILYTFHSQDSVIESITLGEMEESPTIGVEISEESIRTILSSEDQFEALREAYEQKEISVQGIGVWNTLKVGVVKTIANIVLWFF